MQSLSDSLYTKTASSFLPHRAHVRITVAYPSALAGFPAASISSSRVIDSV